MGFLCKNRIPSPSPQPWLPCPVSKSSNPAFSCSLGYYILQYLSETISSEFFFPYLFSEEKLMVDIQTFLLTLHFLQRWKTESGSLRDRQCLSDFEDTLHSVVRDGRCQCQRQENQILEELAQEGRECLSFPQMPILSTPVHLPVAESQRVAHLFQNVLLSCVMQPSPPHSVLCTVDGLRRVYLSPAVGPPKALSGQAPGQRNISELCFTPMQNEDKSSKPMKVGEEF